MENDDVYDVVIIGSGPGGYVAGIRAAQLGLKSCVIENGKTGGVCLNIGCIPSKSLIHEAEIFSSIGELKALNVEVKTDDFNYKKVFEKSRKAADTLSRGVQFLLKKNHVDLIKGTAVIESGNAVKLNTGRIIKGKNIIIATGSRPREIQGFEFDGKFILSSTDALMMEELPKSIVILGAGAIGVEFAHILNSFGVEVTLVEMMETILPLEDRETVSVLARSFRKRRIKSYTSTKALSVTKEKNSIDLLIEGKDGKQEHVKGDKLLVVVGRATNTENIGLKKIGLATERGFIPVGDYYETKVKGVFAVGDVIASPQLAHVASKEGETAVEYIAGKNPKKRINPLHIPSGVYCEPQIASFGYTEENLKLKGIPYKKAGFPYRGAGKSVAIEKPEGQVKVLFDPETKEILGAHIVGYDATELIHEMLLAETAELLPEDIANMIHAHPTLSEAVMESMRAAEGWAIHV
ncbi:MAG: dihydrolipoyl dehydrogenase [Spirochaetales bacterium]|nr:dihydrolipoyl dehydrogenase [Spirochaetales bacterium]